MKFTKATKLQPIASAGHVNDNENGKGGEHHEIHLDEGGASFSGATSGFSREPGSTRLSRIRRTASRRRAPGSARPARDGHVSRLSPLRTQGRQRRDAIAALGVDVRARAKLERWLITKLGAG
jgi:hypothetical protein